MPRCAPSLRVILSLSLIWQAMLPTAASAGEILGRFKRLLRETTYQGKAPKTGEDCAMEELAENIDWLEHHTDTYGSIVAKQPDIWGEARLTKHRDEYERMMFGQLNQFRSTINASITQSDSSFLSQAIALSIAAGDGQTPTAGITSTTAEADANTNVAGAELRSAPDIGSDLRFGFEAQANAAGETLPGIALEPTVYLDQMSRYLQHLHSLRRINEGDDTSDSPGYSLNLVRVPVSVLPGKLTREGFGAEITLTAEPVISDDLLPTTFRNLAINDVVDFMGLPVVRSTEQLPAIESALRSQQPADLLADAINQLRSIARNKNINGGKFVELSKPILNELFTADDAVDAVTQALKEAVAKLESKSIAVNSEIGLAVKQQFKDLPANAFAGWTALQKPNAIKTRDVLKLPIWPESQSNFEPVELLNELISAFESKNEAQVAKNLYDLIAEFNSVQFEYIERAARAALGSLTADALAELEASIAAVVPTGRARRSLNPLNPSSFIQIIGIRNLLEIASFYEAAYAGRYIRWNGGPTGLNASNCLENRVDLLDVRRFLQAETDAAYKLLSDPDHLQLFAELAAPESGLASQIRRGHLTGMGTSVENYRRYFFHKLHDHDLSKTQILLPTNYRSSTQTDWSIPEVTLSDSSEITAESPVEALAWAIVVESALLNQRLNLDVRKLAKVKGAIDLETNRDLWFFLPETVAGPAAKIPGITELAANFHQANDVFKRYVAERWPIHVFAVDPREQDQNVADTSQRRRELQFAMAVGFANGQIGANSLTQFAREMETQVETISLNRTIVAFGHGTDTFGWRFQPRVQSLPVPGTLGTLRETLMGTSRDNDLRQRKLEPGKRECTALVLMPSFVPYCDFDIRTNWYKLTNPKNAALTMKDTLKLSRSITRMRNCQAKCVKCEHLYRPQELRRMLKRIDQLDSELPLQTQRALVPYENTLGGFEMFNTGVTDLSPELIGWYGAPGVRVTGANDTCGCFQNCQLDRGAATEGEINAQAGLVGAQAMLLERQAELAIAQRNNGGLASPLPECEGPGTTIYLVGSKFSVHDTRVIAGGTCVPQKQLISRDIMRVTIPSCVNTVTLCENGTTRQYVSVYVSTPYGVTNHLHIPVAAGTPAILTDSHTTAIQNAANSAVEAQLRARRIAPQGIFVQPADNTRGEVRITAVPSSTGNGFQLRVDAGRNITLALPNTGDPRYRGQPVVVEGAITIDGVFLNEDLVEVANIPAGGERSFLALGSEPNPPLLQRLQAKLSRGNFRSNTGGSHTPRIRIVYFVKANGQQLAERLIDEIVVTVNVQDIGPVNGAASGSGTNSAITTSELLPSQPDFNSDSQSLFRPRTVSNELSNGASRAPVRFAQFTEPAIAPTTSPITFSTEVLRRLDDFEQSLREINERIDAGQNAIAEQVNLRPLVTTSEASTMRVQLVIPDSLQRPEIWDPASHPVVSQTATRWSERWRNLRDRLPRQ